MSEQIKIKSAFERMEKTLKRRPALGQETLRSTCRLGSDLNCEIQEGDWKLNAGMPQQAGGNGLNPTPGVLGRAALGSCIAIGFQLWAAKLEIPIKSVEVEIEADSDDGGLFGTSNDIPGYSAIRYTLRIESSAHEDTILDLARKSEAHSPWLDNITRSIDTNMRVEIIR